MKRTLAAVALMLSLAAGARAAVSVNPGGGKTAGHARTTTLVAANYSTCTGASAPCAYSWTQTAGTSVSLSGANTSTATFTAPTPSGDNEQLTFQLTVTGADAATATDSVKVGVVKTVSTTNDEIVLGNPAIAAMVGRQLLAGSSSIPFTYFDTWNANGLTFATWTPDIPPLTVGLRGKVNVTNGSTAVTCSDSSCKFTEDVNGATGYNDFRYNLRVRDLNDLRVSGGGSGYPGSPSCSFSGGGGSGATCAATVSGGVVTAVAIGSGGSGYTSAPTLLINGAAADCAGTRACVSVQVSGGAVVPTLFREVKLATNGVNSNTSLTLASAWPYESVTGSPFDTQGHSATADTTTRDWWLLIRYYDLAYCLYVQYYRTGLTDYLTAARRVADSTSKFDFYREGRTDPTGGDGPPPREALFEGMLIRNLETGGAALPWIWDWCYRYTDFTLLVWHENRYSNAEVYDAREQGYVQLYAARLSQVLPDQYPAIAGGSVTDGATKRGQLLTRAQNSIAQLWEDTQFYSPGDPRNGLWLWDTPEEGKYDSLNSMVMMGALVEGMVATYEATQSQPLKAKIVTMMKKLADGLTPLFRTGALINPPSAYPNARYRALWGYAWGRTANNGGGTALYTDPSGGWGGTIDPQGDVQAVWNIRQQNAEPQILWGFVYKTTGIASYKTTGDDAMGGSFGDAEDPIGNIAQQTTPFSSGPQAKMWDQNYRRGGSYLVDRLSTSSGQADPYGAVRLKGKVKLKGKVSTQ
jgi:hypothetical protein